MERGRGNIRRKVSNRGRKKEAVGTGKVKEQGKWKRVGAWGGVGIVDFEFANGQVAKRERGRYGRRL